MDETGDHGLSFIDENFPIFLLCGCLISAEAIAKLNEELDDLKVDFFGSTEVILHSRDIRKCEGAFQRLFDLELKARFYKELNTLISKADFNIIGGAVNKTEHIKRYGKGAADPYALSFSFILERMVYCLDNRDRKSVVDIHVEKRGKKEDRLLIGHFNSTVDGGTYYVSSERLKHRIADFRFHSKLENINGLQLADLCAYPLARYVMNPEMPSPAFEIIKDKIYCDRKGRFDGWGLKVFP